MVGRRFWLILLVAAALIGVLTVAVALACSASDVRSVSPVSLAPTPDSGEIIHVVQSGETLGIIALRYGVRVWDLVVYNKIADPDWIYIGQTLRIPRTGQPTAASPSPTPTPTVRPTPTPTARPASPTPVPTAPTAPIVIPCQCEEIVIQSPAAGITVTNPVTVSGLASSPFEQTVVVAVLDGSGAQVGLASGTITGEYGQQGPFSVAVPFTMPANSQPGRIQVYTTSPRDGAIEHLSSVSVMLRGAGLDPLLQQLESAVKAKDYARLQSLMGPMFALSVAGSERVNLAPADAIERLRVSYLGPGAPRLDFSVDARALLASQMMLDPDTSHVVYSTGWGADRGADAFLLIGNVEGQARWIGLVMP